MPHFVWDRSHDNVVYADIAGLYDTGGDFINFINCFINKFLFNIANSIRFLVPITKSQIDTDKGASVVQ